MGIPAEKVEVVYPGSGSALRPVDRHRALQSLKNRYSIEGPFLFYVGGSDFRKNLNLLIRSFADIRGSGYPGKLVLAGETLLMDIPEVWELRAEIQRVGLESLILFPGYVSDEVLSQFFSACDFFVFPSLYEGFGLPVLEAMKCGAPLLISRSSSLPEVAGDCAHYFDPAESDSLVSAFLDAYENSQKVDVLRKRGLERAKRFSWRAAAERIQMLYSRYGN
jgi:glycosyltransferase involved in cell wall biosynthesis